MKNNGTVFLGRLLIRVVNMYRGKGGGLMTVFSHVLIA